MADNVLHWRPTKADERALEFLQAEYPFLTNKTDVIRFCLHQMVAHHKAGDTSIEPLRAWTADERAALNAEIDAELRKLAEAKRAKENEGK